MKVLIVDDNANDRKIMRYTLERHGCAVIEALDGHEGLALAIQHQPDIIVSDALMPRMDGFQLLRAAKADPYLDQIPFLVYSATYTDEKEVQFALSMGAETFLVKPVGPDELWDRICEVMKRWGERQGRPVRRDSFRNEEEYLREYNRIVASLLEKKIVELEEALALRKQAENELLILNAELKERVVQEVEKNREKESIMLHQARLAAMGEMLSNIAHQWRQPLNNVALYVQNLEIELAEGNLTPASCHDDVQKCLELLTYLSSTINNFCSFYQPDHGRRPFDLCRTVSEAISLVREELEFHGIAVKLVEKCSPCINGFEREFSQVLLSIVQNAKEAINLRKPPDPLVEIVCSQEGKSARITITDNGGGIPA
ncbi:MAG TPA: hybrid sensor histidine kinase/response regulator, partial [Geobacteraceae bacterium]